MQRKARIDASGAVHPIIARGIERGKIFAVREANISQAELSRRFDTQWYHLMGKAAVAEGKTNGFYAAAVKKNKTTAV